MIITRKSAFSGTDNTMDLPITPEAYNAWRDAGPDSPIRLIQNAFPHLDADQREFMLTGVTPDEWNKMFGGDDADDEVDLDSFEETR